MSDFALDLDELLDAAVLEAALADGRDPALAARQFGVSRVIAAGGARDDVPAPPAVHGQANRWSAEDMTFLRANAGLLGEEEIGVALGRSVVAVKVRSKRLGLHSPTNHPDYLTAQRAALTLGVDVHAVCGWIDRGLLAAELAPLSDRKVWRIRRSAFYAWAMRPENWVYFIRSVRRPERIRDERLRRLLVKRKATWGDEWWTTGEAAEFHGVESTDVQRYIVAGRLPAVKYQNWMVLRSEATRPRLRFFKGKGAGVFERSGTPAGDAFIVLATAVGIPWAHISRMTRNRSLGGAWTRWEAMKRRPGYVPWLIRAFGLPVLYRAGDGAVWADWRPLAHRFPALARDWAALERGEMLDAGARYRIGGVLRSAAVWAGDADTLAALGPGRGVPGMGMLRDGVAVYERVARE